MITTPFFIAATTSIILPSIIDPINRSKICKLSHIAVMIIWVIIMVIPVTTRINWLIIIIATLIMMAINFIIIKKVKSSEYMAKSILILINIIISITIFANSSLVSGFNSLMQSITSLIEENYTIIAQLPAGLVHKLSVAVFGIILATVGINHPIAFILKVTGLTPNQDQQESINKTFDEPARGKAIGYLERFIVLLLMITNNAAAIGFVLAAKAFARFKQLDKRDFAEYVLIGTLMSVGSTIVIGIAISAYM